MSAIKDKIILTETLKGIEQEINKLNDRRIVAFFEALGLNERDDIPKNYLEWETILIVVPNRYVSNDIKKYKYTISRIAFITNTNAKQIQIYEWYIWEKATQNKTSFQIRQLLKTNFGGVEKISNNPDWIKLK
jgi:hypothetical protein